MVVCISARRTTRDALVAVKISVIRACKADNLGGTGLAAILADFALRTQGIGIVTIRAN